MIIRKSMPDESHKLDAVVQAIIMTTKALMTTLHCVATKESDAIQATCTEMLFHVLTIGMDADYGHLEKSVGHVLRLTETTWRWPQAIWPHINKARKAGMSRQTGQTLCIWVRNCK